MSWNINEKELKEMKINNPRLYQQIEPQLGIKDEPDNYNDIRLKQVDYASDWASKHMILARIIKFILNLGGYNDSQVGR